MFPLATGCGVAHADVVQHRQMPVQEALCLRDRASQCRQSPLQVLRQPLGAWCLANLPFAAIHAQGR
ncbi:hypothetical protein HI855_11535 [Cyanobacteria bacterium 150NLHA]|uniref:hypothetical protein n=1 Tax=Prochlorococcus TaxID=1218 RepID=UPI0007B38C74|nr:MULTISPECIES: hypothetical protein [Prochlorococcus]NMO84876.1 hypothetical protein [Prochlorococcus sp. P1344]NMP07177.1 hypothetical protein [Prochlorococcus sp. P1361]